METNEAPEKIYLQENTTTDCYGEFWPEWFEARAKDTDIEYTRTDAFIKEVCEWLDNELCCYIKAQDFTIDHARLNKDLGKHLKDEIWE